MPPQVPRLFPWRSPLVTVFAFLAQPEHHIFLEPKVTKLATGDCGFDFHHGFAMIRGT